MLRGEVGLFDMGVNYKTNILYIIFNYLIVGSIHDSSEIRILKLLSGANGENYQRAEPLDIFKFLNCIQPNK